MQSVAKINYIMSFLAKGIYRPWYWQHYKQKEKQQQLRAEWLSVTAVHSYSEIKQGLSQWVSEYGEATPPTPDRFFAFLAPKHTDKSRFYLSKARSIL